MIDREQLLRAHIRQLLLPYALAHLTTNHIDHSESEVSRLLSESLDIVPLHDPTFLALPVEPLDAFNSLFRVKEQSQFTEAWKVDIETRTFLTKSLGSLSTSTGCPTTNCLSFHDPDPVSEYMSTILTRRAISETPELGKLASNHAKIISTPSMLSIIMGLELVPEDYIEVMVLSVKEQESLLGVRYSIDKDIYDHVMHLITHIACAPPGIKDIIDERHNNTHPSRDFLRDDSPPFHRSRDHMSPPIFPVGTSSRYRTAGPGKLSEIQFLGFIKEVEFINDVEDISKEHMQVINGWTIMPEVSSDTPSLGNSSQTTDIDELFALTPPQNALSPKMDEYLIPRVHQPGADSGKPVGQNDARENLYEFLSPLLLEVKAIPSSSDSVEPQSSRPEIPSSVLGQPPSFLKSAVDIYSMKRDEDLASIRPEKETPERLRTLIETVCAPVHDESPEDWILSERLEEKEALMMEVPKMKEPCIHPPSPSCPAAPNAPLSLISANNTTNVSSNATVVALKKAPGSQLLNIELSWRPFNYGFRFPTTEEVTNAESFYPITVPELDDVTLSEKYVKNVISSSEIPETKNPVTVHVDFDSDNDPPMRFTNTFGGDYDIVLTNADRRKIYASYPEQDRNIADNMILESSIRDEKTFCDPMLTGKSNKRLRIAPSPVMDDLGLEVESADSGQGLTTLDVPWPNLLSPEINKSPRSFTRCNDDINGTTSNGGESSRIECGESGLRGSPYGQQEVEMVSGDRILIDTSLRFISPGEKSATVVFDGRNAFPANNSESLRKQVFGPARQALTDFLHLRARDKFILDVPESPVLSPQLPLKEVPTDRPASPPREIPQEIVDASTVELPLDWSCPATRLKCIASMNVLQKTVLVEYLQSECLIDLIERENAETHGADLILDVDTALLYVPLSSLHLSKEKLAERIAAISWRFEFIMVVFEAFSSTTALRPQRLTEGNLTPYAFPPMTIKAIKTLKKLLTVMEMVPSTISETKTAKLPSTVVKYAYAWDVLEAAKFTRLVGDELIGVSDTEWLTDKFTQDEKDLSHIPGMNIYAAALLLRYTDVSALVDMTSVERLGHFSNILGERRVMILNDEIKTRLAVLESSSPPSTAISFVEDNRKQNVIDSCCETENVELFSEMDFGP